MAGKRILMVGPVDFSTDNAPKVHFSNLAKWFSKLDFDVLCIVYTPEKEIIDSDAKNFRVCFSPNPLIGNKFVRILKYLFLVPLLLWQFFKFKPKIVYFRFSPPAFLYLLVLKLLKIFTFNFKIALEFNDWTSEQRAIQDESKPKVKVIEFFQLKSVVLVDYVRVVTSGIKDKLNSFGVDCGKVAVIGNGTDIDHFKPIDKTEAKEKIGIDPNFLYVGFIGNFAVWQGLDTLLISIPEVLKRKKDVRFILVGDGPEMTKIKKKIAGFKNNEIILTGRVPYGSANNYINSFDVGVAPKQPNITIGYSPLKIRDYSACGVPIVSSRIKGLEIIEEKNFGILVEPGNPLALARAIIKLLNNAALRKKFGKNGRKVAEVEFSWKNVVEKILNMINK